MEGVVFAPYYGVLLDIIHDDRTIIDGCFGKNGHYPPRPEDEVMSIITRYSGKTMCESNEELIKKQKVIEKNNS